MKTPLLPPRLPTLLLVLAGCWLPPGAAAGDAPAAVRPDVMTRAELRQCLDRQAALERRRLVLDRERELGETEAAALAQEARLLSAQMRSIDSADAQKLTTFNVQLASHNESVKRYNASLEALGEETAQLNADTADMMAACTTRLYSRDDREDIERERAGAGSAPP